MLPHQFRDTDGREWTLAVHPHALRLVREATGFNLGTVMDDDLAGWKTLAKDPLLLADVLFALCSEDAAGRGVTAAQFGRALGGGAMGGAFDALWVAYANFCRSQVREPLLRLAEKEKAARESLAATALEAVNRIDPAALVREISNASAGSSPASAGSTPPG